jgi:hypothetical protein
MPGARPCRLARRLAAGLSPAQIARAEGVREEEVEVFMADRALSRLVEQYGAVCDLPRGQREAALLRTAWQELWHLINIGDKRALLFVAFQANRAQHPVRQLVKLVVESLENARRPREQRDTPSPAGSSAETMQGYGQHPLGPAHYASRRLVDFLPAQTGEAILISDEVEAEAPVTEPPAAEAPVAEPAATGEDIPIGDAGVAASADDENLSRYAAFGRDNPELAEWFLERFEKRVARLLEQEAEPDGPGRSPGHKPLGP